MHSTDSDIEQWIQQIICVSLRILPSSGVDQELANFVMDQIIYALGFADSKISDINIQICHYNMKAATCAM